MTEPRALVHRSERRLAKCVERKRWLFFVKASKSDFITLSQPFCSSLFYFLFPFPSPRQCAHARSRQSGPAATPARRAPCLLTFAVDQARLQSKSSSSSLLCRRFVVVDVITFGFFSLLLRQEQQQQPLFATAGSSKQSLAARGSKE